jgi:hypothetical protein
VLSENKIKVVGLIGMIPGGCEWMEDKSKPEKFFLILIIQAG